MKCGDHLAPERLGVELPLSGDDDIGRGHLGRRAGGHDAPALVTATAVTALVAGEAADAATLAEHARALKLPADWVLIKHPNGQDFLLFKSGSEKHHRHAKALAFQKSLGQP